MSERVIWETPKSFNRTKISSSPRFNHTKNSIAGNYKTVSGLLLLVPPSLALAVLGHCPTIRLAERDVRVLYQAASLQEGS